MTDFVLTSPLIITWALGFAALLLLVPMGTFVVECLSAVLAHRPAGQAHPAQRSATPDSRPSVAILIPAHNEAVVIEQTLRTLMPQCSETDQVIVIADNCTDNTAAIAHTFDVTVLERHDTERRGKGYALDFGLTHLAPQPPEIVVVLDADCLVQPGALQTLVQKTHQTQRPVQSCYLMEQPPQPTAKSAVSALAFLVKNKVRPLGLHQWGLPCLLTGTGMAFPWDALQAISLASGNIVEDMQVSVDLAIASSAPVFCNDAQVLGQLPQQDTAATQQRTRWEHGHLQTSLTQIPRLLQAFSHTGRKETLALALDLSVPPLSLLILLWLALTTVTALLTLFGLGSWPMLGAIALEGILMLIAVTASWFRFGRDHIPGQTLLSIPLYILWKIPLYFAFLVKPQAEWVRTARDSGNDV